ncbi:hypothetical protein [Pararobbsia silviterrae]|uniref:Uncharacterized protein n=1 Tax=Pararobbsia silviterrae TaxID=1792498 RepID=A0A494Y713_9BURK|nr:hypothetical protein [Pararobbsia silviterrae]RKP56401.1 hypothetical protein D7S86_08370 [Pararobbsia silviterrae]
MSQRKAFEDFCREHAIDLIEKPKAWRVWQAARTVAIEEAAKICDHMRSVSAISYETGAACADAIRALGKSEG